MHDVFREASPNHATGDPEQPKAEPKHPAYKQQTQQVELKHVMPVDEPVGHGARVGRRPI